MHDYQLHHAGSRTTSYLLRFMLEAIDHPVGRKVTGGLPAGSIFLEDANLVIGGTPCTVPLFRPAMERVARERKCDVLIVRHGMHPEVLDPVLIDAVIWSGAMPVSLTDMICYLHIDGELWVVPSKLGPHVRLARNGAHIEAEPPFLTWHQRTEGVCSAAKQIVVATQGGEDL